LLPKNKQNVCHKVAEKGQKWQKKFNAGCRRVRDEPQKWQASDWAHRKEGCEEVKSGLTIHMAVPPEGMGKKGA
jgi:hypothetical protein